MKKIIIPSIIASIFLIGCGSGSSSSSKSSETTVKVADAYIVNANVCDVNEICAETDGNGTATAEFDLNSRLISTGGFIDANMNGVRDANEIDAPVLMAPFGSKVITPLTDLIALGAKPEQLSKVLNINETDLYKDPMVSDNINLIKAVQIASTIRLEEGNVNNLVDKINNYSPDKNIVSSALPMGGDVHLTGLALFANYVNTSLSNPTAVQFVNHILKINETDRNSLIKNIETEKQSLINYNTLTTGAGTTGGSFSTTGTTGGSTSTTGTTAG